MQETSNPMTNKSQFDLLQMNGYMMGAPCSMPMNMHSGNMNQNLNSIAQFQNDRVKQGKILHNLTRTNYVFRCINRLCKCLSFRR